MSWYRWRCSRCAREYLPEAVRYTCPACPGVAVLDLVPDYELLGAGNRPDQAVDSGVASMWRYRRLLPVAWSTNGVPAALGGIGWTPLTSLPRLAAHLGLRRLIVKDEARNLTGSLKDRASAVVVAKAHELGESVVTTASSGNAAVALAGCCAATGMRCVVFVPDDTPQPKLAQLRAYGATIRAVDGGYAAAVDACYRATARHGWYCRSTGFNPFTAEGKKTTALEIAEQLGWRVPDVVVVPTGDGNILAGLHRGFLDAFRMGWTDGMPRLVGVQSDGAPALFEAWRRGHTEVTPSAALSRAESINVAVPQDGYRALRAMRETHGCAVTVSDGEAMDGVRLLARLGGVFAEPSSATTVAALPGLLDSGVVRRDDVIVLVNTGNGLKDPLAATGDLGAQG